MADAPQLKLVPVTTGEAAPAKRRPPPVIKPRPRKVRVVSVGGGKGGIGKSLISANLGIELARRGKRVVLVDADLGGANLHTCLGLEQPQRSMSDFVDRRVEELSACITETGIANLGLVSGALDHLEAANPNHAQKMRLLRHVQTLDADFAIMDLGAGTHFNVLDFFLVSDHGVLVLVPEPTSVENAYRFVKAAFWRRLKNVMQVYGYEELVKEAIEAGVKSPLEVLEGVAAKDADAGATLMREMRVFRPRLVVNQVRTPEDQQVGHAVVAAWKKYFGLDMDLLGAIQHDGEMWRTVRSRKPLLLERPDSPAAGAFARIADGLIALEPTLDRRLAQPEPAPGAAP